MKIFENFPENLIELFNFSFLGEWLIIIRIIFILFSFFFVFYIIFALLKTSWLKLIFVNDFVEILTYRPFGLKKIEKDWKKMTLRLDTGLESEYKLAVIEADNTMNETLKRMGYGGESLGERLEKLTAATISNIEEVKKAHQVRNNIIHDPNYKLSLDEAKRVLGVFEKAFRGLEAF